jgi:ATP-binding protein involved in chromosome partitioning
VETPIFGHGGVHAAALRMGLPFLGEIPIDLAIREGCDQGVPMVVGHPDSPQTAAFMAMAKALRDG